MKIMNSSYLSILYKFPFKIGEKKYMMHNFNNIWFIFITVNFQGLMSILQISYVKLSKTTWRQNLRFLFEKKC